MASWLLSYCLPCWEEATAPGTAVCWCPSWNPAKQNECVSSHDHTNSESTARHDMKSIQRLIWQQHKLNAMSEGLLRVAKRRFWWRSRDPNCKHGSKTRDYRKMRCLHHSVNRWVMFSSNGKLGTIQKNLS